MISTRHAGIPDVVIHGETGLLCDEHDVDTMSANMLRVLETENLAAELGLKAKTRIKDHFSMQRHIDQLNVLLTQIVH